MANHGPTYGLSREIQLKNESRFVLEEAQETLDWIQQCTGKQFDVGPNGVLSESEYCDLLRDGVQLCMLANRLLGEKCVKYTNNARMPFHKMENISNFLAASKEFGVPAISCFQTVDLYEDKQPYKVVECLRHLAATAQKNGSAVPLPQWVVRLSSEHRRKFDDSTLADGKTLVSLQYGTNRGASQKGMRPYGLTRQIMPDSQSASPHGDAL